MTMHTWVIYTWIEEVCNGNELRRLVLANQSCCLDCSEPKDPQQNPHPLETPYLEPSEV